MTWVWWLPILIQSLMFCYFMSQIGKHQTLDQRNDLSLMFTYFMSKIGKHQTLCQKIIWVWCLPILIQSLMFTYFAEFDDNCHALGVWWLPNWKHQTQFWQKNVKMPEFDEFDEFDSLMFTYSLADIFENWGNWQISLSTKWRIGKLSEACKRGCNLFSSLVMWEN